MNILEQVRFIGKTTTNSTSGFTGWGTKYIEKNLQKISDISSSSTVTTTKDNGVVNITMNWTSLYGELENGDYVIYLGNGKESYMKILLSVNSPDDVSYEVDQVGLVR